MSSESSESVEPILIRSARLADIPQIASCIKPYVEQGRLLQRTISELDLLIANCFVALQGGEVVGCAALEVYSPKLAEVRSLAVVDGFQKQGVGRRLVEACVARARQLQILEVMAITSSEEFFRGCGFDFTLPGEKKALFLDTRLPPHAD